MTKAVAITTTNNSIIKDFPPLNSSINIKETLSENLDGDDMTPREIFPTISVPSGGGTAWDLSMLDNELNAEKEFEGIIIHIQSTKARFIHEYGSKEAADEPMPVCVSDNGIIGVGEPGGRCINCDFNKYGTASKGNGKACGDKKLLFALTKNSFMPVILNIPPMSFKPLKEYMKKLSWKGQGRNSVVTKFKLTTEKSQANVKFSIITFNASTSINTEELDLIKQYQADIIPFIKPTAEIPEAVQVTEIPEVTDTDNYEDLIIQE